MYGKLFASMYDGTLVEDWRALVTFQQMIVLCDADGVIEMTAEAISRRTGIPVEHIKAGIEILESTDPLSRSSEDDGRRIRRIEEHRPWGWFIVNHSKYRSLQDSDSVRAQNRERKQRQRERDKSRTVTDGHAPSRHTDTDTNTDKNNIAHSDECASAIEAATKRFEEFWKDYPQKKDKKRAQKAFLKLSATKQQQAILDVKERFADVKPQDLKFIPYPTTYIRGERWNDELDDQPSIDFNRYGEDGI